MNPSLCASSENDATPPKHPIPPTVPENTKNSPMLQHVTPNQLFLPNFLPKSNVVIKINAATPHVISPGLN